MHPSCGRTTAVVDVVGSRVTITSRPSTVWVNALPQLFEVQVTLLRARHSTLKPVARRVDVRHDAAVRRKAPVWFVAGMVESAAQVNAPVPVFETTNSGAVPDANDAAPALYD